MACATTALRGGGNHFASFGRIIGVSRAVSAGVTPLFARGHFHRRPHALQAADDNSVARRQAVLDDAPAFFERPVLILRYSMTFLASTK